METPSATIACPDNRPQMATVRPGVMQKLEPVKGAKAEVIEFNPGFEEDDRYVEILDIVKAVGTVQNIMDAKILVSGGRGVGSKENFAMLQDLADVLGGMVSCSRAVVENGWLPQDYQVGQTGKTVRPNVYFAIRYLRSDPARSWYGGVRYHHRHQQGCGRSDLRCG